MDLREIQQHQLQQQQQQQQRQSILMNPNSYRNTMINPNSMSNIPPSSNSTSPSSGVRLSFNSLAPPPPTQNQSPKPLDAFPNIGFDGSQSSQSSMRFNMETAKKKRGRPRKYTPDGNIALGLSPNAPVPSVSANHGDSYGVAVTGSGGTTPTVSETTGKRNRGRPPGSGKKQLDALGGTGGVGFTPHVITVKAGEDIASKIMAFLQQGPRTVCVLSANGAICNVTLRQPATSGGTVTYEGRFEIISLSGSFLLSEENGSRSGGLSVSLAGPDGRVLGGGVAGMLVAASQVQVIVGSFIADGKKQKLNSLNSGSPSTQPQMLNFGAPVNETSPRSQEEGSSGSDSSDEDGSSSALNDGGSGTYNNPAPPIHNMPLYQLWSSQPQK